jgi:putative ABC transport system ATP-binding protein
MAVSDLPAGEPTNLAARIPTYELRGATKTYGRGRGTVRAVQSVDLRIEPGEFVAIVGKSGSGKTTLLQLLGALDRASSGQIFHRGKDLTTMTDHDLSKLRREAIGFIFQQFNLIPTLSARANIEVALAPMHLGRSVRASRVLELLEMVGLSHRADHLPSELSGGEQQRVAIGRALANRPAVLLADEPTGNLDAATGEEILDLLRDLADNHGHTVIVVTHDQAIARAASRMIKIRDGRIDSTKI